MGLLLHGAWSGAGQRRGSSMRVGIYSGVLLACPCCSQSAGG